MRRGAVLVLALVLTLTGCGSDAEPEESSRPPTTTSGAQAGDTPPLPDGWRWEALGGVQVGVPGDWGWGNSSQRIGQWCIGVPPLDPIVGRPGVSTLVGCPGRKGEVDPSTLMDNTGIVVELALAHGGSKLVAEGDQEVRQVGDVVVRVIAPPRLRERILATVHQTDVDAKGCPMFLPAEFEPGDAPEPAIDVTTLTGVSSVAACRYPVQTLEPTGEPIPLFSSLALSGEQAEAVVSAIADAPAGGGPDDPESCSVDYSYGDEMLVVLIDSDQGRSAVHIYYSGCDHNGFDDGTTVRALTRDAIQPLIADANRPWGWSGTPGKSRMLHQ